MFPARATCGEGCWFDLNRHLGQNLLTDGYAGATSLILWRVFKYVLLRS